MTSKFCARFPVEGESGSMAVWLTVEGESGSMAVWLTVTPVGSSGKKDHAVREVTQ